MDTLLISYCRATVGIGAVSACPTAAAPVDTTLYVPRLNHAVWMRVGVYVDGYNLYYGGRRVVYCTARVDGAQNPSAHADQDVYLKALHAAAAVDHIAYGNYVSRVKSAPLATKDPASGKPVLATSKPPVRVKDSRGQNVPDALFMVSYLHNEEKGTDVNVASHLLIDVTTGAIDAAIVISNDSDLGFPIRWARSQVPVAVVNPRGGPTAGEHSQLSLASRAVPT